MELSEGLACLESVRKLSEARPETDGVTAWCVEG